jgi:hypothetical protein
MTGWPFASRQRWAKELCPPLADEQLGGKAGLGGGVGSGGQSALRGVRQE